MKIFNLSIECYPVAKVGGLADVVGALPKYLNKIDGIEASVVMPWYNKPFVQEHSFEIVFDGWIHQHNDSFQVIVMKERSNVLGFDLYLVKIPGLLDRDNPYGYWDESQQFLAFQHGVLHWLTAMKIRPDVLHCHDYHTGLVPFMVENCPEFNFLKGVKTIGTIHNGEYQGIMKWEMLDYFPWFDGSKVGLLDWNGFLNPLATMIKCCHAFNAVSGGYMDELFENFRGLESLLRNEHSKAYGIINGIDTDVWNPKTDSFLDYNYDKKDAIPGKQKNKNALCKEYELNPDLPLFSFIGRFAGEKGADFLPAIVQKAIQETEGLLNFVVLGSGDKNIENQLLDLSKTFSNFALDLGYKEYLSHKIYASSDFLIMPSRVEPCGLNQMYAMRYGTIPIVHYIGGLRDTVEDLSTGGSGINFSEASAEETVHAIHRAMIIYNNKELMNDLVNSNMNYDFSWEHSAQRYLELYRK
ncbi:glycogen synthase [Chryseobacterium sp. SNU WT5]|uniref:glycogen synthase n=1 Tax=Chryseobacterium sp. SNU WT5 TaxID=2594269 RepID=UPI0011802968|nr:glycogen/starch synthase [Chryseobacterium sp. SNU WT5]QDP86193.1 glycogen synthase [Chryseobacterium sp. SNU WT5]